MCYVRLRVQAFKFISSLFCRALSKRPRGTVLPSFCGRFRPLSASGVGLFSLSETRFIQLFVTIIENRQIFYRIHFFITVKAHDGLPRLPAVKICSDLFVTRSKTCRKRKGKKHRRKTNKQKTSKTNVKQHLTNAQTKLLALHYLLLTFA